MPKPFQLEKGKRLVLASASPRRKQLLATLIEDFIIHYSEEAEPIPTPLIPPKHFARLACCLKARAIGQNAGQDEIILAADTVVSFNKSIYGKPASPEDAFRMLKALNGKTHQVFTAFCILHGKKEYCESVCTLVRFGEWPDNVLEAYANSEEPLDKAGAYAIQGNGAFLVERLRGSYTNVVGLPLEELARALLRLGIIAPV